MTALEELREAAWIGMDAISDPEANLNDYADAAAKEVLKVLPTLVTPLVWEEDELTYTHWTEDREKHEERSSSLHWSAQTEGFSTSYQIVKITDDRFRGERNYRLTFGGRQESVFHNLEAAKAAANAHHVAQVMAALDIQQIGERDEQ